LDGYSSIFLAFFFTFLFEEFLAAFVVPLSEIYWPPAINPGFHYRRNRL